MLRWAAVDLDGRPDATPPIPPSISVLRSVRRAGDTKTRKSRRRLALPRRCVQALRAHRARLDHPPAVDDLVRHVERHRARLAQRPPIIPSHRHGCRTRRIAVAPARDAAQLRLAALGLRCAVGAHLAPGRPVRPGKAADPETDFTQVAAMQSHAVQACSGRLRSDVSSTFPPPQSVKEFAYRKHLTSRQMVDAAQTSRAHRSCDATQRVRTHGLSRSSTAIAELWNPTAGERPEGLPEGVVAESARAALRHSTCLIR